jgi:uncharacterized protein (TIGR02118 family)
VVKLVCLVRRKPGMTPAEFHRYWREQHGPLVIEASGKYLLRYEQNHRPLSSYKSDDDDGFDGLTVEWFESEDAFWAMVADPSYAERLHPDEQKFLDLDRIVWFLTEEPDVFIDTLS